jgi:hypothetical protein
VATISDLQRALSSTQLKEAKLNWPRIPRISVTIPDPPRLDPEILRWSAEKAAAPVETRNAVLALLEETRSQARWLRWTFFLVALSVILSLVALLK